MDFPEDNVGYGFDNIADVLTISPLLFEKYVFAAESLVEEALAWPRVERIERIFQAEEIGRAGEGEPYGQGAWDCWGAGGLDATFRVEQPGRHVVSVRAFGIQAGDETVRMDVTVNAAPLASFEVEAGEESPGDYAAELELLPGDFVVRVELANPYHDPTDPDVERRTRRLLVDRVVVDGPLVEQQPPEPESRRRLLTCEPDDGDEPDACARQILTDFAGRAWRRPAEASDVDLLFGLYEEALDRGDDWQRALQVPLAAVLLAPRFLARFEPAPPAGEVRVLDGRELASRLSYFLWSAPPDDLLIELADDGSLIDPAVLADQVDRMLADPRSQALVTGFADQWLDIRGVDSAEPDYAKYPEFDEPLRLSMRAEMELVFRELIDTSRPALDLLDADYTYVDARLARHYGLPEPAGEGFVRVDLSGHPERGGLFGMAGWLLSTSHNLRTSPVRRGVWVLTSLLCQPLETPPADVPPLDESAEVALGATLRERMEAHRSKPQCQGCHDLIDPIGFGLENYDVLGQWRETEAGGPIDASGTLVDGRDFDGPGELATLLKDDPAVSACMVKKMFTYALGRGPEADDACLLEDLTTRFEDGGYLMRDLLVDLATSPAFTATSTPAEGDAQ